MMNSAPDQLKQQKEQIKREKLAAQMRENLKKRKEFQRQRDQAIDQKLEEEKPPKTA